MNTCRDRDCLGPVPVLTFNYSLSPFRAAHRLRTSGSRQPDPHAAEERDKNLTRMTTRWETFMQLNQPSYPAPSLQRHDQSWHGSNSLVKTGKRTRHEQNKDDPVRGIQKCPEIIFVSGYKRWVNGLFLWESTTAEGFAFRQAAK